MFLMFIQLSPKNKCLFKTFWRHCSQFKNSSKGDILLYDYENARSAAITLPASGTKKQGFQLSRQRHAQLIEPIRVGA